MNPLPSKVSRPDGARESLQIVVSFSYLWLLARTSVLDAQGLNRSRWLQVK